MPFCPKCLFSQNLESQESIPVEINFYSVNEGNSNLVWIYWLF